MGTTENWSQVAEVIKLRNDKRDEWLKNVIIAATTLIGILISLHKDKSENMVTHILFCSTVGILSLGILSGAICLFSNINALHRFVVSRTKELNSEKESQTEHIFVANPLRIFDIARNVCYISLFLSIPTLAIYAMVLDS